LLGLDLLLLCENLGLCLGFSSLDGILLFLLCKFLLSLGLSNFIGFLFCLLLLLELLLLQLYKLELFFLLCLLGLNVLDAKVSLLLECLVHRELALFLNINLLLNLALGLLLDFHI